MRQQAHRRFTRIKHISRRNRIMQTQANVRISEEHELKKVLQTKNQAHDGTFQFLLPFHYTLLDQLLHCC
jgi:hypothetical protein